MILPLRSKLTGRLFLAFFFSISVFIKAQVNIDPAEHLTIADLKVSYSMNNSDIPEEGNNFRSNAEIILKDNSSTVIHFKILNTSDNSVIYQVDYSLSSSTVKNSHGITLFKKEGLSCFIVSKITMPLTVYEYRITTENSQGIISDLYSEFK